MIRPLDVLDTNTCAICLQRISLLTGVGWLHSTMSVCRICERAVPEQIRCPVCGDLLIEYAGKVPVHVPAGMPAPAECPGYGHQGLPPLREEVAFLDADG